MANRQLAIKAMSYVILFCGIAQLIVSGIVISNSNAFGAAWYTGLACIFAGSQGVRLNNNKDEVLSMRFVKWIFAAALFSTVFSIFGAALDGTNFLLFGSLNACAEESTTEFPLCYNGTSPFFSCVGEQSYFHSAVQCQQQDGSGQCSCVSSMGGGGCQKSLNGFPSCLFIITDFVTLLQTSFILCLCCLVSSGIMVLFTGMMWCCSNDLRDSSSMNDSLVSADSPVVITAEAQYANQIRASQMPVNVSFVEVRPLAESIIGRNTSSGRSSMSGITGKDILMIRPSNVHEVTAPVPGVNDAIVTPVMTAFAMQPVQQQNNNQR